MKLFKYELYRYIRNIMVWGGLSAVIAFGVLIMMLGNGRFIGVSAEVIAIHVLSNPLVPMWSGALLSLVFFGADFQNRSFNILICSGYSRFRIVLIKALLYYLLCTAALAAATICMVWTGYGGVTSLGDGFIGRLIAVTLINCATITVPMVIIFVFQDMFASAAINVIFAYVMQKMIENSEATNILRYYPAVMQLDYSRWNTSQGLISSMLVSVLFVIIGILICGFTFKYREMK